MGIDDAHRRQTSPTGHLQRVPPHDTQTEQNLLGAALLNRDAAALVAQLDPVVFFHEHHARICDAIVNLVEEGKPVDLGTVAAVLRARGELDGIRGDGFQGAPYLLHLQAITPSYTSAPTYASFVVSYHHKRHMLSLAGAVVEAVYSNLPTEGLVSEMTAASEAELVGVESSWDLVNLVSTLAGEDGNETPAYLYRTDGVPLLYQGKVHAFNAESETGKSMLAIWACAERIAAGEHVGYIDFEDSPRGVIDRLLGFGVSPAAALDLFHYVRPDDPIDAAARLRVKEMLRVFPLSMVVIDGVAEALALTGWKENDAADVTTFYNMLPRLISRAGVTVVLIDHLVKDKERQGNDARGSGHKRAGIDGASFKLEVVKPFVRGGQGIAKVILTKDRPAHVRPYAKGKNVAEMHLSSDDATGALTCELRPPTSSTDEEGHFRPTWLMEKASEAIESAPGPVSKNWVVERVGKRKAHVLAAIDRLVEEGYVRMVQGSYVHLRTFGDPGPQYEEE